MTQGFEKRPWLRQSSQRCKPTMSLVLLWEDKPTLWRDAALGWKTRALQRRSLGNGTVSLHQCSSHPCVSAGFDLDACECGIVCRLYVSVHDACVSAGIRGSSQFQRYSVRLTTSPFWWGPNGSSPLWEVGDKKRKKKPCSYLGGHSKFTELAWTGIHHTKCKSDQGLALTH